MQLGRTARRRVYVSPAILPPPSPFPFASSFLRLGGFGPGAGAGGPGLGLGGVGVGGVGVGPGLGLGGVGLGGLQASLNVNVSLMIWTGKSPASGGKSCKHLEKEEEVLPCVVVPMPAQNASATSADSRSALPLSVICVALHFHAWSAILCQERTRT